VDEGPSILQYTDDTIIFLDHDSEGAKNLKLLLSVFEQLSGLKVNYRKSEIFHLTRIRRRKRNTSEFQCTTKSLVIMIEKE
jgi:hypothetical protein